MISGTVNEIAIINEKLKQLRFGSMKDPVLGKPYRIWKHFSVVYFAPKGNYRVYWPWPSKTQEHRDFFTAEEVDNFFEYIERKYGGRAEAEAVQISEGEYECIICENEFVIADFLKEDDLNYKKFENTQVCPNCMAGCRS